jgi:soluble lytic murein transglycosylase-like protein
VLSIFGQPAFAHAITAFAGLMAFPLAIPTHDGEPVAAEPAKQKAAAAAAAPSAACLAITICEVKDRVRWRTPAWKPQFCERIAAAVRESAERYDVPPSLILAVMINESDMNERSFRTTMKNGSLYAKDGGLMGIRCIVDKHGRCVNGNVRGLTWTEVMDPVKNIDIGARELGHWAHGGGVTNVTVRTRGADGKLQTKQRQVPCPHRTHAYWAHYNHGPRYIDRGPARHYPHRVAVLYYALARVMNVDTSSLTSMHLTVADPGKRPRTADRPVEARYRKLCEQIRGVGPVCSERSTAQLHSDSDRPN